MELYRKVKVSDRLPDQKGLYHTSEGYLYFNDSENIWDNVDMIFDPEYWFEPVILPSEDEIKKKEFEIYTSADQPLPHRSLFERGVDYIINKIKGGQNESI